MKENYFYVLILISKFEVRRWNWNFVYRAHTSCEISLSEIYVYLKSTTRQCSKFSMRCFARSISRSVVHSSRRGSWPQGSSSALHSKTLDSLGLSLWTRHHWSPFDEERPLTDSILFCHLFREKNCSFFNNFIAIILSWEMNH